MLCSVPRRSQRGSGTGEKYSWLSCALGVCIQARRTTLPRLLRKRNAPSMCRPYSISSASASGRDIVATKYFIGFLLLGDLPGTQISTTSKRVRRTVSEPRHERESSDSVQATLSQSGKQRQRQLAGKFARFMCVLRYHHTGDQSPLQRNCAHNSPLAPQPAKKSHRRFDLYLVAVCHKTSTRAHAQQLSAMRTLLLVPLLLVHIQCFQHTEPVLSMHAVVHRARPHNRWSYPARRQRHKGKDSTCAHMRPPLRRVEQ